ncbi:MAG: DUF2075 domain-containing protein [Bacteroidota bacterium]|nr:DUF2075 domain-containing protein [Bacteroidota bacterium]
MIIYQNSKGSFLDDILTNNIEQLIAEAFRKNANASVGQSEKKSWKHSLQYMNNVLQDPRIPEDAHISIEYRIPQTSKRIDFIITGQNEKNQDHAVIIELKQWETAELTEKDAVVKTFVGGSVHEVSHPCYQAWSYATLLTGFNETVYSENIELKPCAYLHNYVRDGVIDNPFYSDYIEKAPLFLKADALKLREFIRKYIRYGDRSKIMYRIDAGRIKPSKSLADSLASMIKGNDEFILIDDQKVVYETAVSLARRSSEKNKTVLIIEGGPGTGKTVVAINLLVHLTKLGLMVHYVSKNAAPRAVYESKLTGTLRKTHISNMFKGSGSYVNGDPDAFDALIVDEAHRLNEKSGLFGNLGENQIKEIIHSAKCSVFFIDEDQRVTLNDIGRKDEIRKWAGLAGARVFETELSSQFRCNGSDGYIAWLDNILQIHETANVHFDEKEYDFRIFSSPNELRDAIFEKNRKNNKARLVAGHCWDWVSKKDPKAFDIHIPPFDFNMRWNLASYGSLWLIDPNSVNEIGCIHTCQGLELDYVGVIIGPDLKTRQGKLITDVSKRSGKDSSVKGFRKLLKEDDQAPAQRLDRIVKNTYRTLMTRGLKGCYIYCTDKDTELYFRSIIRAGKEYGENDLLTLAAED